VPLRFMALSLQQKVETRMNREQAKEAFDLADRLYWDTILVRCDFWQATVVCKNRHGAAKRYAVECAKDGRMDLAENVRSILTSAAWGEVEQVAGEVRAA
jgi:hypothetical protein